MAPTPNTRPPWLVEHEPKGADKGDARSCVRVERRGDRRWGRVSVLSQTQRGFDARLAGLRAREERLARLVSGVEIRFVEPDAADPDASALFAGFPFGPLPSTT